MHFMTEEEKKKNFDIAQRMLLDAIRKRQKENDAKRRDERRKRNGYWLQIASFVIAALSLLLSWFTNYSEKVWRWIESLRPE